ncbi:MAG: methyltransferase domain-containing protein [Elusimicrobia bacterium]|nr:methyltransferase domain-containing protein [Elusimicrobiota bacterium]
MPLVAWVNPSVPASGQPRVAAVITGRRIELMLGVPSTPKPLPRVVNPRERTTYELAKRGVLWGGLVVCSLTWPMLIVVLAALPEFPFWAMVKKPTKPGEAGLGKPLSSGTRPNAPMGRATEPVKLSNLKIWEPFTEDDLEKSISPISGDSGGRIIAYNVIDGYELPIVQSEQDGLIRLAQKPNATKWLQIISSPFFFRNTLPERVFGYTGTSYVDNPERSQQTRSRVADVETYTTGRKGLWVDVGAGSGETLDQARRHGWSITAVEFNRYAVPELRRRGIPVVESDWLSAEVANQSADVLSFYNVLQHISDPNGFLQKAHRVVKQDGLLVVRTPDYSNLTPETAQVMLRIGRDNIFYFTGGTLTALLIKNGFEVVSIKQSGSWEVNGTILPFINVFAKPVAVATAEKPGSTGELSTIARTRSTALLAPQKRIDEVDDDNNVIGQVGQDDAHNTGAQHRSVTILLVDKETGQLVFQKRALNMKHFASRLDVSVGGHVESGSSYEEAAQAEISEELPILLAYPRLRPVEVERGSFKIDIDDPAIGHNRELKRVYIILLEENEVQQILETNDEKSRLWQAYVFNPGGKFTEQQVAAIKQKARELNPDFDRLPSAEQDRILRGAEAYFEGAGFELMSVEEAITRYESNPYEFADGFYSLFAKRYPDGLLNPNAEKYTAAIKKAIEHEITKQSKPNNPATAPTASTGHTADASVSAGDQEPWRAFIRGDIQKNPAWTKDPVYRRFRFPGLGWWRLPQWRNIKLARGAKEKLHMLMGERPGGHVGLVIGFGQNPGEIIAARDTFGWNFVHAVEFVNTKWWERRVERAARYLADHQHSPQRIALYHADARNLRSQFEDGSIDGLYAANVTIKPYTGLEDLGREVVRMLKPGGYAYLRVPGSSYPMTTLLDIFEKVGTVQTFGADLGQTEIVFHKSGPSQRGDGSNRHHDKGPKSAAGTAPSNATLSDLRTPVQGLASPSLAGSSVSVFASSGLAGVVGALVVAILITAVVRWGLPRWIRGVEDWLTPKPSSLLVLRPFVRRPDEIDYEILLGNESVGDLNFEINQESFKLINLEVGPAFQGQNIQLAIIQWLFRFARQLAYSHPFKVSVLNIKDPAVLQLFLTNSLLDDLRIQVEEKGERTNPKRVELSSDEWHTQFSHRSLSDLTVVLEGNLPLQPREPVRPIQTKDNWAALRPSRSLIKFARRASPLLLDLLEIDTSPFRKKIAENLISHFRVCKVVPVLEAVLGEIIFSGYYEPSWDRFVVHRNNSRWRPFIRRGPFRSLATEFGASFTHEAIHFLQHIYGIGYSQWDDDSKAETIPWAMEAYLLALGQGPNLKKAIDAIMIRPLTFQSKANAFALGYRHPNGEALTDENITRLVPGDRNDIRLRGMIAGHMLAGMAFARYVQTGQWQAGREVITSYILPPKNNEVRLGLLSKGGLVPGIKKENGRPSGTQDAELAAPSDPRTPVQGLASPFLAGSSISVLASSGLAGVVGALVVAILITAVVRWGLSRWIRGMNKLVIPRSPQLIGVGLAEEIAALLTGTGGWPERHRQLVRTTMGWQDRVPRLFWGSADSLLPEDVLVSPLELRLSWGHRAGLQRQHAL